MGPIGVSGWCIIDVVDPVDVAIVDSVNFNI